jgi:opacity protein-like surface antigen
MACQSALASRDAGASLNLYVKKNLSAPWFLLTRSNLASRDHFDERFLGYTGFGLGRNLSRAWSVRAGYRHLWFRPRDQWLEESRPYIEAFWQNNSSAVRWTARQRLERRRFNYRDDESRLRLEWVASLRAKIPSVNASPYFENELFYSLADHDVTTNWLGVGLAWRPQKGLKLKMGYRWNRFRVGQQWRHRDVLVLGASFFL